MRGMLLTLEMPSQMTECG